VEISKKVLSPHGVSVSSIDLEMGGVVLQRVSTYFQSDGMGRTSLVVVSYVKDAVRTLTG
jgi:hypothetical protein